LVLVVDLNLRGLDGRTALPIVEPISHVVASKVRPAAATVTRKGVLAQVQSIRGNPQSDQCRVLREALDSFAGSGAAGIVVRWGYARCELLMPARKPDTYCVFAWGGGATWTH
jgi:hypothetical protein